MPSITLANFRTKVYGRLEGNTRLYPTSTVDRKINEALKVTNLFTGWSQGRVTVGFTAVDRMIYRTPAPMLVPLNVYLERQEVMQSPASDLGKTKPQWLRGLGSKPMYWVPLGISMFALVPTEKRGGQFLEAWGVTEPAALVNATDTTELADEFDELVVEYAYMNATIREPGKVFTDASRLYQPWLKKINELRRWQDQVSPRYWIEKEKAA